MVLGFSIFEYKSEKEYYLPRVLYNLACLALWLCIYCSSFNLPVELGGTAQLRGEEVEASRMGFLTLGAVTLGCRGPSCAL